MRAQCAVEGCGLPVNAKGFCRKHYGRWKAHGDPLVVKNGRGLPLIERFMARVRIEGECWVWTGGKSGHYGRFSISHTDLVPAHRWSYEYHVGPIGEGLTIDHVKARGCVSTLCVNPAHLEPVTLAENLRRALNQRSTMNAAKTRCPKGHLYDGVGTKGERTCRRCRSDQQQAYIARKRAASA